MKKFLSGLCGALMASQLILPSFAGALSPLSPKFNIEGISSTDTQISIDYNADDFPLQGNEFYYAECYSSTLSRAQSNYTNAINGQLVIANLVPNLSYDCSVAIRSGDNVIPETSPAYYDRERTNTVSIATKTSNAFVSVNSYNSGSDYIDFWLSPMGGIQQFDYYYVECKDPNGYFFVQTSQNPNQMRVSGLYQNTRYSCAASLKRDNYIYYRGNWVDYYTTNSQTGEIYIEGFDQDATSIEFNLSNPGLGSNEEFYVECTDTRNVIHYGSSRDSEKIVVSGLTADSRYDCRGGTRNRSTLMAIKRGPVQTVYTDAKSNKLKIDNFWIGDEWVKFDISGGTLYSGDSYIFRCDNENLSNDYRSWTSTDEVFTLDGMKPSTPYTCYAAINRKAGTNSWITEAKSDTFRVVTSRKGGSGDRELAPWAGFNEEPIRDWSQYKNPFEDTNIGEYAGWAAAELYRRNVIQGYSDGLFRGDIPVNRAEAAKFLILARYGNIGSYNASNRFSDVVDGAWYEDYVGLAAEKGIIDGYPDGTFRPANTINRAEFIKMIARAFGIEENLQNNWVDVPHTSWFARFAGAAGRFNYFPYSNRENPVMSPERLMSRNDVAIAIHQYLLNR